MSKIKTRLEKLANVEEYAKFVADVANLSDDLDDIIVNAKNNEELYKIIMNDDEKIKAFSELQELNKSLGFVLLQL